MLVVTGPDERRDHLLDDIGRDGKADAGVGLHWRLDGRCHADDVPRVVHQHAARVTRVDGRVGLDDVGDGVGRSLCGSRRHRQRSPK